MEADRAELLLGHAETLRRVDAAEEGRDGRRASGFVLGIDRGQESHVAMAILACEDEEIMGEESDIGNTDDDDESEEEEYEESDSDVGSELSEEEYVDSDCN